MGLASVSQTMISVEVLLSSDQDCARCGAGAERLGAQWTGPVGLHRDQSVLGERRTPAKVTTGVDRLFGLEGGGDTEVAARRFRVDVVPTSRRRLLAFLPARLAPCVGK